MKRTTENVIGLHVGVRPAGDGAAEAVGMNSALMFSKASDEWRTPKHLFEALDAEFGFDLDVAASAENCWVGNYFGPDRVNPFYRDALAVEWHRQRGGLSHPPTCWMNPPYSQCRAFMAKAASEAHQGCTVVCLVPSRTDTRWWHETVWYGKHHRARPGVEIRFLRGRLKFGGAAAGAPFPSVVIIFRPPT